MEAKVTMAPKTKTRPTAPTPVLSRRKTRSVTAGKREDPPPAKKARPSSNGEPKRARTRFQSLCAKGAEATCTKEKREERERVEAKETMEQAKETMAPKTKTKTRPTAPTPVLSRRKTRSVTAGKRADPPPAKKARPSSNGEPKRARSGRKAAEEKRSDAEEVPVSPAEEDDSAAVVPSKTIIIEAGCAVLLTIAKKMISSKEN